MNAYILCGGKQTRLSGYFDKPKCLLPCGGDTPFILLLLEYLQKQTLTPIVVTRKEQAEDIMQAILAHTGRTVSMVVSDDEPLFQELQTVAARETERFMLVNGDTYFRGNLCLTPPNGFIGIHTAKKKGQYGFIYDGEIQSKISPDLADVDAGAYSVLPEWFKQISPADQSDLPEIVNCLIGVSSGLFLSEITDFWDIGTPTRHWNFIQVKPWRTP